MTLEEILFSVLGPLVVGRVFPDVAPLDTPKPYVTYQLIGGPSTRWLDGTAADKVRDLVQINVWGARRADVKQLARQIEDAMCASQLVTDTSFVAQPAGQARSDHSDMQLDDAPQGVFGSIQDFNVISKR